MSEPDTSEAAEGISATDGPTSDTKPEERGPAREPRPEDDLPPAPPPPDAPSPRAIVTGYNVAAAAAYVAVVAGVVLGILPVPALLMLLTIPLARQVSAGLMPNYDNPYGLMAFMGVNVRLHLFAGVLLLVAYVIVIGAALVAPGVDLFIG